MGLDNYAAYPEGHSKWTKEENLVPHEVFPTLNLCGGLFSAGCGNSFRGKVYNDFVYFATGYSLYEDVIPNDDVGVIVEKLSNHEEILNEFNEGGLNSYGISLDEVKDLVKWFETVHDEGAQVTSWW